MNLTKKLSVFRELLSSHLLLQPQVSEFEVVINYSTPRTTIEAHRCLFRFE